MKSDRTQLAGEDGVIFYLLRSLKEALLACEPLVTDSTISVAELAGHIELLDSLKQAVDDWNTEIEESESILDATLPMFASRQLRWHYRSQHESLIAFSNHSFYGGKLILFPSPNKKTDDYGILYSRVPRGSFTNRRNIEERLISFDRDIIRQVLPATLDNQRLLRPVMMDALLEHEPTSKSEFLEYIPGYLRHSTASAEGQFLEQVLEIINASVG